MMHKKLLADLLLTAVLLLSACKGSGHTDTESHGEL